MLRIFRTMTLFGCAAMLALLAACGGGDDDDSASQATATPGAKDEGEASQGGGSGSSRARVRLRLAAVTPGEPVELGESARVGPDDRLQFVVGASRTGKGSPVTITIPKGPAERLEATASAAAGQSRAVIRSSTGDPIELEGVRYSCGLPPATVCPAEEAKTTDDGYELTFSFKRSSPPVVLSAVVAS
jgi:hypothetical protein